MPKKYNTAQMIKEICSCLIKKVDTPSGVARCTKYDPRTVSKYVEIAEELGIIKCDEMEMGRNKVRFCTINPDYMKIYKKLEEDSR